MKNKNFELTLAMLAKMCGVSVGTVDRALHGRGGINEATKERILTVARRHGYIDSDTQSGGFIGIVVFDVYNRYFAELLMELEADCRSRGYSLAVMFTDKDEGAEYNCIKQLYFMGAKGIVLCPINEGECFERFACSVNIPVVTVGNKLCGVPYVGIDNAAAMYDAAEHLRKKCESIIYYSPALMSYANKSAQTERYEGFLRCAREHNITFKVAKHRDELDALLCEDNKSAILCSTDHYMMQVALKYPGRMVMGFDGTEELTRLDISRMWVDTKIKATAKKCLDAILSREKEDVIIPHEVKLK